MAYAIFRDEEKISRTFPTRDEALQKADEAGLVDRGNGEPALEDNLTIKPCAPDIDNKSDDDLDWAMKQDRSSDDHKPQHSHSGSTEGFESS